MATKLYVGQLPYSTTDDELKEIFSPHGTVESAKVIMDRETGRSKGFGFVEMSTEDEANAAIKALDQQEVQGRKINVSVARPMAERPPRDDYRRSF